MTDQDAMFDKVMDSIGNNGYFQKRFNYFYNFVVIFFATLPFMNIILALTIPEHWCHVPGRNGTNYTLEEWKSITLPRENDTRGMESHSSCLMYNITDFDEESIRGYSSSEPITCQFGYEYDTTWYSLTVASQEDWVCQEELHVTNTFVVARIGEVVGTFIIGQLGDKIGRRPVFYLALFCVTAGRVLSAFTAHWYYVFLLTIIIGSFTSTAVFVSPLIIAMETSRSDDRAHIAMTQCIGWTLGICAMPMIMWWVGNWFPFLLITSIPLGLFIFADRLMIESPRWLLSTGKKAKCVEMLKKIAKVNGTTLNEDALSMIKNSTTPPEKVYGMMSLFSSLRLAKNTTLIITCWIVCSVAYFTLTLNVTNLAGNPFLNFLYQSAVELPAYILGRLSSDKIGRRWTAIGAFLFGFLASIPLMFIINDQEMDFASTIISSFMKFCTTITFYVVNLQAMETYPTCLRQTGISMGSITANLFGVLGPYIVYLGTTFDARYPYLIMGVGLLIGALAGFFLPETLHQKLPETLAEAHEFGKDQSFLYLPKKIKDDELNIQEKPFA